MYQCDDDDDDLRLESMDVDDGDGGKENSVGDDDEDDDDDSKGKSEVEDGPELKKQCVSVTRLRAHRKVPPPPTQQPPFTVPVDHDAPSGARVWQLTKEEAEQCLFAFFAWVARYEVFKNVPASTDKDAQDANHKELAELSEDLCHIWTHGRSKITLPTDVPVVPHSGRTVHALSIAYTMFYGTHQFVGVTMTQSELDKKFETIAATVTGLFDLHRRHNFCNSDVMEHNKSMSNSNNVLMALQNTHRMLTHGCAIERVLNPAVNNVIPSKHALFSVENFREYQSEMENAKGHVKILLYLIAVAAQKSYRRYRGSVYKEKFTAEGYRTYYWEWVSTIETFITLECSRDKNRELSMLFWERGAKNQILDILTNFYDIDFPTLYVDRHVFSFRNGIYFAAARHFAPYDKGQINWGTHTYVRNSRHTSSLPKVMSNASANYFDVDFVEYATWDAIPTPTVDKILNDQEIPADAQKAIWGFIGRLLYEVGELDDWQVILWFLGRANSGKSTMCKLVNVIYRDEDVAVLSNNIEEVFGLEAVYNKFCFVAPEIKRDFKLPQALFQSMVSGEGVSISRKNRVAESTQWTVPGVAAGNEVPRYVDSSNSFVRRLAMVHMIKGVKVVDGEMSTKLKQEVAGILSKANQAYHMMLASYGYSGVWEKLPPYFKQTQHKLKCKTHPLHHYLQSGELDFGADLYVTLDSFRASYVAYVNKCNLARMQWSDELYMVPFEDHKLAVETVDEIEWPIGTGHLAQHVTIVRGVSLRSAPNQLNPIGVPHKNGGPSPVRQEPPHAANSKKYSLFRKGELPPMNNMKI